MSRRLSSHSFVLVLIVALVGGCQPGKGPIVGNWMGTAGEPWVFKADQTFKQGDGEGAVTGRWFISDKKIAITIQQIGGKPPEEELRKFAIRRAGGDAYLNSPEAIAAEVKRLSSMNYLLSDDGKTMSEAGAEEANATNTLTKVEQGSDK